MPQDPQQALVSRLAVRHRTEILSTLLALVGDLGLAEDLLQDTLVEIIGDPEAYDPARDFVPWARGIARNLAHRHWRESSTHRRHAPLVRERLADLLEQAETEAPPGPERMARLHSCLDRLSERVRHLLLLRYGENVLGDDLADRAGMPRASIRTTLLRARRSLMHCLQADGGAHV